MVPTWLITVFDSKNPLLVLTTINQVLRFPQVIMVKISNCIIGPMHAKSYCCRGQ
jgi:hypothetical protein